LRQVRHLFKGYQILNFKGMSQAKLASAPDEGEEWASVHDPSNGLRHECEKK